MYCVKIGCNLNDYDDSNQGMMLETLGQCPLLLLQYCIIKPFREEIEHTSNELSQMIGDIQSIQPTLTQNQTVFVKKFETLGLSN